MVSGWSFVKERGTKPWLRSCSCFSTGSTALRSVLLVSVLLFNFVNSWSPSQPLEQQGKCRLVRNASWLPGISVQHWCCCVGLYEDYEGLIDASAGHHRGHCTEQFSHFWFTTDLYSSWLFSERLSCIYGGEGLSPSLKCLTSLAFRKFLVKLFRTWAALENGTGIHEGFTVKWVLQNFVYLKISHFVLTSCLDSSHSQQRERYEEVIHLLYRGDLSGQDESAPLDAELLPPGAGSEQPPARQTAALRGDESQVPLARWNL